MDQFGESISREIQKLAEKAELRLIPEKSRDAYCKEYEKLLKWMESKNSKSVNESLMLAYMMEMSSVYKSSTLWCIHSKLQAMLRLRNGVDLASFHKLHAFMKAVNKGYEANKSFVFTEEELRRFFVQAPDDIFLFLKNMPSLIHEVDTPFRRATFGMGCFWANDCLFGATPGVLRTRVGYSGGTTLNPVYRNLGDHTEVIEVDYDPKVISFEDLLEQFWNNHEYGLSTKIKKQYASLILYHDEEQRRIAEKSLKKEASKHKQDLITQIQPAGTLYPAEDYHQKYRLQQHNWLCEVLGLTPQLLQTSHVATRLNGYVVGVGTQEDLTKDIVVLGLSEKVADYVQRLYEENKGGSLYC